MATLAEIVMMRGEILQGKHPEREDLYQKLVEWRHAALGAIEIGVECEYLANQLEPVKSILQASPEPWVRDLIDLMLYELRNNGSRHCQICNSGVRSGAIWCDIAGVRCSVHNRP